MNEKARETIKKSIEEKVDEAYHLTSLIFLTISTLIISLLSWSVTFYVIATFSILILFKILFYTSKEKEDNILSKEIISTYYNGIVVILIGLLLIINIGFGYKKFYNLKYSSKVNSFPKVSFSYNEEKYSTLTMTNLVYAGETSQYIFLYDKTAKSTLIFSINKIDNLLTHDPLTLKDEEQSEIVKVQKFLIEFWESQYK